MRHKALTEVNAIASCDTSCVYGNQMWEFLLYKVKRIYAPVSKITKVAEQSLAVTHPKA